MVAKIIALNGSPKGNNSTTIQFVKYIQRKYPEREIRIFHIAEKLKYYENNMDAFQELIDEIQSSEGFYGLFRFMYYMCIQIINDLLNLFGSEGWKMHSKENMQ